MNTNRILGIVVGVLLSAFSSSSAEKRTPQPKKPATIWILYSERDHKLVIIQPESAYRPLIPRAGIDPEIGVSQIHSVVQNDTKSEFSLKATDSRLRSIKTAYNGDFSDGGEGVVFVIDKIAIEKGNQSLIAFWAYQVALLREELASLSKVEDESVKVNPPGESTAAPKNDDAGISAKRAYGTERPAPANADAEAISKRLQWLWFLPVIFLAAVGIFVFLYFKMMKLAAAFREISAKQRELEHEFDRIDERRFHENKLEAEGGREPRDDAQREKRILLDKLERMAADFEEKTKKMESKITTNSDASRLLLEKFAKIEAEQDRVFTELRDHLVELEKEIYQPKERTSDVLPAPPPKLEPPAHKMALAIDRFYLLNSNHALAEAIRRINGKFLPVFAECLAPFEEHQVVEFLKHCNGLLLSLDSNEAPADKDMPSYFQKNVMPYIDALDDFLRNLRAGEAKADLQKAYEFYLLEIHRLFCVDEIRVELGKERFNGEKHQLVGTIVDPDVPFGTIVATQRRGYRAGNMAIRKPWVTQSSK